MVTKDHYATLGLSPASEDVVIRAAYVALVRRYHPDGNPSAAAAARTRAINAAYAVLSDPDRRAEYDLQRASEQWGEEPPRRWRAPPTGLFAAAAMLLLLLLLPLAIWSPASERAPASPEAPGRAAAASQPEPALPDPIEAARPAADTVLAASSDANVAPQPTLAADRARSRPTAALPQLAAAAPSSPAAPVARMRPAIAPAPSRAAPAAAPLKAAAAATTTEPAVKPSFNCSIARTRGEIAVCGSPTLANLDRQQALLYSQSWSRADAAKRARLISSRERFIARRDACRSAACTSGAYLARMREVSDIMTQGQRLR